MIVPMKRLTLIGLKEDESALLQALQAIKAVQILPPEEGRESERVAQLESRVQRLNSAQLALRRPNRGWAPSPRPRPRSWRMGWRIPCAYATRWRNWSGPYPPARRRRINAGP